MHRKIAFLTILVLLIVSPFFGQAAKQIQEPVLIHKVEAVYPELAAQARVEGIVILEFTVGIDGRVSNVKIVRSIPILDNAAIEAVKQWKYKPGLVNGKPAAFPVTTSIRLSFTPAAGNTGTEQKADEESAPPTTFTIAQPKIASPSADKSSQPPEADSHPDAAGKGVIPDKVKKLLDGGLAARKGRQDNFLFVAGNLVLPGERNELHSIFNIKMRNGMLDFVKTGSDSLGAKFNVFAQFHRLVAGAPEAAFREIGFPGEAVLKANEFDPKQEDLYCFGYSLPLGSYLLALAVTSSNQKKIGVAYYEFLLPDSTSAAGLETTPIVLAKNIQQSTAQETGPVLRQRSFNFAGRIIVPNVDFMVGAGEELKIVLGVLGAKKGPQNKLSLELSYEIQQEGKMVMGYPKAAATAPLVIASLPLKKVGTGKAAASGDLPSGGYSLVIRILDKVSKKTAEKRVDFFRL